MPRSDDVRAFILNRYSEQLKAKGLQPDLVPDDFDLLAEGIIDSMGVLDIVNGVEEQFSIQVDLESVPPEDLTVIGPLSRHIAQVASTKAQV